MSKALFALLGSMALPVLAADSTYDDVVSPFMVPESVHTASFNAVVLPTLDPPPATVPSAAPAAQQPSSEDSVSAAEDWTSYLRRLASDYRLGRNCEDVEKALKEHVDNGSFQKHLDRIGNSLGFAGREAYKADIIGQGLRLRDQIKNAALYCAHYRKAGAKDMNLVALLAAAHAEVASLEVDKLAYHKGGVFHYPSRSLAEIHTLLSGLRQHAAQYDAAGLRSTAISDLITRYNAVMRN
jgi:hypothetical protein